MSSSPLGCHPSPVPCACTAYLLSGSLGLSRIHCRTCLWSRLAMRDSLSRVSLLNPTLERGFPYHSIRHRSLLYKVSLFYRTGTWYSRPIRCPNVASPFPQSSPAPRTSGPSILEMSLRMLLYSLLKSIFSSAAWLDPSCTAISKVPKCSCLRLNRASFTCLVFSRLSINSSGMCSKGAFSDFPSSDSWYAAWNSGEMKL